MSSFTFPFDAAARALDAMEGVASQLRSTVALHDGALSIAHQDFQGETRASFDRDVTSAMDELSMLARLITGDAERLRATIADAHRLEAAAATTATPP